MILCDNEIKKIGSSVLSPYNENSVGSIVYDLQCDTFGNDDSSEVGMITLAPGDSVFIKSIESINVPTNLVVKVILRNSRIRQGLSIEAPVYQPGHQTRVFFRVTNISKAAVSLKKGDGVASIMFETIDGNVEHPYSGVFQDEIDFRGMGKYGGEYARQMSTVEKKIENVKELEKHIYSNVLSIMAVFVAIFSLININIQNSAMSIKSLISLNLVTIGSVGTLIAIVHAVLSDGKNKPLVWIVCIAAYSLAILLQYI